MYFLTREDDAYSTYPRRFYLPYNPSYHAYQPAEFPQQYYGMRSSPVQMMAPQFAPAPPLRSDSPASSTSEELSSTAPKKKNSRWTETEEKFSSSCSVITKRSFTIKHTIRQNGNLLQVNYTRDAGENTFQATRRRNNVKIK